MASAQGSAGRRQISPSYVRYTNSRWDSNGPACNPSPAAWRKSFPQLRQQGPSFNPHDSESTQANSTQELFPVTTAPRPMQAFRPALWRQARRAPAQVVVRLRRGQHDQHGPHKEYFQTPGRMPVPDTTPFAQPYVPAMAEVPSPAPPGGHSRLVRASRSILWAALFGTIGVVAGSGLITWEYMQPPFEAGSAEEQDLLEEIEETLESHPLVDALRNDKWWEDNYYVGRMNGAVRGQHLVSEKLSGIQGITMKTFKHPSENYTIMVFFLGFGIEGWPDVIHGGIITTLLQEGVDQHVQNFYPRFGKQDRKFISVDFKVAMRPGDIYAILVPPAQLGADPNSNVELLTVMPMVLHMEAAPRVETQVDPLSNTEKLMIEIPTANGENSLHALATVQLSLANDVDAGNKAEHEEDSRLEKIQ